MPVRGEYAPRPLCTVSGCDRQVTAKDLCRMHYTRQHRGKPLRGTRPEKGSPSGHGRYGILDDDGHTVLCHECGKRFTSVGGHLRHGHDLTVRDYKIRHGLPLGKGLVSQGSSEKMSRRSREQVGTHSWDRFEQARDPAAASAARDEDTFALIAHTDGRAEQARRNGTRSRQVRVVYCAVCGAAWCPLPGGYTLKTCSRECWDTWKATNPKTTPLKNASRDSRIRLQHRSGVTVAELAAEHDVTHTRIRQILDGR